MRPSPIAPQANPQQRDAITTDGPGSGTTCTRVERVVARITAPQGHPAQSLVVPFPAPAAQELTTHSANRLGVIGVRFTRNARYLGTCHASGR